MTSLMDRLDLEIPPQLDVFIVKLSPELSQADRIDHVIAVVVPCARRCSKTTVAELDETASNFAKAI